MDKKAVIAKTEQHVKETLRGISVTISKPPHSNECRGSIFLPSK